MSKTSQSTQPAQNFYFGAGMSTISGGVDTGKESLNFIILQNDFLHKRVEELQKEFNELQIQKDELEEDNERMEVSKTSLKGYVQNQGEFNKLSKKLVVHYDENLSNLTKINNEFVWNVKLFGSAILILELGMILMYIWLTDTINSMPPLLILHVIALYIFNEFFKFYMKMLDILNIEKHPYVLKIREDMKEARKGNDYLNQLIDNL